MCFIYFVDMVNTKITPRKTKEVKIVMSCPICKEEFQAEEQLKTHVLQCARSKLEIKCETCGATFKRKEYLKKHLKRVHGQGSSSTNDYRIVEIDENKETDMSDKYECNTDKESDKESDIDKYDPGNLIGEVSDEDESDEESAVKKPDTDSANVVKENETEVEMGRTVRKPCHPMPVFAPKRVESGKESVKGEDENKNKVVLGSGGAEPELQENSETELRKVKRRKLTRISTKYMEDNRQVEKYEELEEWFE